MKSRMRWALLMLCGLSAVAAAHVTVWPRESQAGGEQRYVVRVPTEGKVATVSTELRVPAGVRVGTVDTARDHKVETKRDGARIVAIVWSGRIEPGEFAEFGFVARNPEQPGELVWKAVQSFADGSKREWIGPPGDKRPAPVTTLVKK